jgi:hypothetical protein
MRKRNVILLAFIVAILAGVLAFPLRHKIKRKIKYVADRSVSLLFGRTSSCYNCATLFDDKVAVHEQAYQTEGILPQARDAGLEVLLANEILIKLSSNQFYHVLDFSYSKPYLLPKGLTFIDTLAYTYRAQCQQKRLAYVPFTISSGTRSVASIEKLMKHNINSIRNSSHLRGKTFDVSYTAFDKNEDQLMAFIAALNQLRKEGRCYVKYERNGTLHITVI